MRSQADLSHPLHKSLYAWWLAKPGQNSFGSNQWRDISGNNRHGDLKNMTPSTDWTAKSHRPGQIGSLEFDATDDWVDIPGTNTNFFMGVQPYTMSMWVDFRSALSNKQLCQIGRAVRPIHFMSRISGAQVECRRDALILLSGASTFSLGWQHLVSTYDGVTMTFYLSDANRSLNLVDSGASGSATSFSPINHTIGAGYSEKGIASFAVWKRGLSESEVQQYHTLTLAGFAELLTQPRRQVYSVTAAPPAATAPQLTLLGVG